MFQKQGEYIGFDDLDPRGYNKFVSMYIIIDEKPNAYIACECDKREPKFSKLFYIPKHEVNDSMFKADDETPTNTN